MLLVRNGPSFIAEQEWLRPIPALQSGEGTLFEPQAPSPTYQYYSIC